MGWRTACHACQTLKLWMTLLIFCSHQMQGWGHGYITFTWICITPKLTLTPNMFSVMEDWTCLNQKQMINGSLITKKNNFLFLYLSLYHFLFVFSALIIFRNSCLSIYFSSWIFALNWRWCPGPHSWFWRHLLLILFLSFLFLAQLKRYWHNQVDFLFFCFPALPWQHDCPVHAEQLLKKQNQVQPAGFTFYRLTV